MTKKYSDILDETENIGLAEYYYSDTCNEKNQSGCTTDYDKSDIKIIVSNWMKKELDENDLLEVNGYKSRIINTDELIDSLGFEFDVGPSFLHIVATENAPEIFKSINMQDWIMDMFEYYDYDVYNNRCIRPVINLKKEFFDNKK